jgi:hypothetical protein
MQEPQQNQASACVILRTGDWRRDLSGMEERDDPGIRGQLGRNSTCDHNRRALVIKQDPVGEHFGEGDGDLARRGR